MEDNILAIVNGVKIKQSDIQNTINRFPQSRQEQFKCESGKKQLLNEMIFFELVYDYAKDIDLDKNPDYLKSVEAAKKEILTQTAIAKVMHYVKVTDEEIKQYYVANKNMYKKPEMVKAKHILVDSLEMAEKITEEINNGLSFEDAARKYSSCPSRARGGDLGQFSRGQMVPEFENVAFNLDIGVISKPVKTQFGYHIIQVYEKIKSSIKSFDEVKNSIRNGLLQERQAYQYAKLNKKLRERYNVEIKK